MLYERQADYFEDTFDAPFMVVTLPVNEKVAETMPAVVHVDNAARIQSVALEGELLALCLLDRRAAHEASGVDHRA